MDKTILILSPHFPYPPSSGTGIDIWGHILFFQETDWNVVLCVCITPESPWPSEENIAAIPLRLPVHLVRRNPRWSSQENPQAVAIVQKLIDRYSPRIVWCEYSDFSVLASSLDLRGAQLWFRPHNFELLHALEKAMDHKPWRHWRGHNAPFMAIGWAREMWRNLRRIFAAERLMDRIADRLFFISYNDMRAMSRIYRGKGGKCWVLPFLERKETPVKKGKSPLDVVYLGSDYANNVNMAGAKALLDEVMPAVNKAIPGSYRFHLIGKRGKDYLDNYSSNNVIIHDFVEDVQGFLLNMDVACLPIRLGWGCKVKMVESLACGLPVIGARQTFRGVPPAKGAYVVCNGVKDYVQAFKLLAEAEAREKMSLLAKVTYQEWMGEGKNLLRNLLDSE